MNWTAPVVLTLLLLCGCGMRPTQLERTSLKLQSGMNKNEVKQLLSDFRLIGQSNEVIRIKQTATRYSTNMESASWILYGPDQSFTLETLKVYFDEDGILIAHYYTPPG